MRCSREVSWPGGGGQGLSLGLGLFTEAWLFCHFRAYPTPNKRGDRRDLVRYLEASPL